MLCGGEAMLFFEYFPPRKRAFLFGAGHLCRSIAPLLKSLDFHLVIIDDRKESRDTRERSRGRRIPRNALRRIFYITSGLGCRTP